MIARLLLLFVTLAALSSGAAEPRRPTFRHTDECGDPTVESMAWFAVRGDVVRVVSARELDLRDEAGKIVHVRIVNVGSAADPAAIAALTALIGGKPVTVYKQHFEEESAIAGEVHDAAGDDVAEQLLRRGLVDFIPSAPQSYETSHYSECLRRIAEREARQAGVGLWATRGKRAR